MARHPASACDADRDGRSCHHPAARHIYTRFFGDVYDDSHYLDSAIFPDKNQRKKREEKRERVYKLYLDNKRKELQALAEKQKQVLEFHFPSFEQMKYLTSEISDRIWEKSLESKDYLQLRLGTGTVPSSYEINMSGGDLANRDIDDLMEKSQHMQRVYKDIRNAPVTVDLAEGPMGLSVNRKL